MSTDKYTDKLAEKLGKPESQAVHRILECAMTEEEAQFILALPASNADLATKFSMSEKAVEEKILDLARRGLLTPSEEGYQFTTVLVVLHDNMLASAPAYIPAGMDKLWMDLYEGEKWWREMGEKMFAGFKAPILRVIPAEKSIPQEIELLPYESITQIIEENRDLISVRNCCCRTGAKKCHHPLDVCMQFKARAEYDLYRGSGRKVSADEAVSIALKAVGSGLIPTVTNISVIENLEFICYCCGCCCMVLHPGLGTETLHQALAPSRFEAKVNYETCNGCRYCVPRCHVGAIDMKPIQGYDRVKAVLDADKCVGCGVCELACMPGSITMELVRPLEFIPEAIADEWIVHL